MNVLVWFKRDLRLTDHPALTLAAGLGSVLPLYIVEPDYWALPDVSARQWAFTGECLADLREALALQGAPLVLRSGDAVDVLDRLCRQHRITRMVSHEETGNLWTYARDRKVANWSRGTGVEWTELPQSGVVRRLASRNGWARARDVIIGAPALPVPAFTPVLGVEPGILPNHSALKLAEDHCAHRQAGGRAQGLALLDSFLSKRGETYRKAMSSPLSGERACSRLSAHLSLGTLSLREAAAATSLRQAEHPVGLWGGALTSFQSRLAWRDHFIQKLEDQPSIEHQALHLGAEAARPRLADATLLQAWQAGETGLPFMDACMRYLAATGWLNFRMRAMVTSFASYHLWLDWRASGTHLARMFTDYEPGIHWPQIQMQSGTTGINIPRIYNPVKQGRDQDPTGRFTRRWLPELAAVPDTFLQEPWKWPDAANVLGRRYPYPIVDITAAARAARDAIWTARRNPDFAATSAQIITRHASRADPRFVNDRAPRRKPQTTQLSLDL